MKYKIKTYGGSERTVSGTRVSKHFAVHNSVERDAMLALTHLQSGAAAGHYEAKSVAVMVAKQLERLLLNALDSADVKEVEKNIPKNFTAYVRDLDERYKTKKPLISYFKWIAYERVKSTSSQDALRSACLVIEFALGGLSVKDHVDGVSQAKAIEISQAYFLVKRALKKETNLTIRIMKAGFASKANRKDVVNGKGRA